MRACKRVVLVMLAMLGGQAIAQPGGCPSVRQTRSGANAATVVELYTSEGCDSCPPADKWFSSLNAGQQRVLPLAFHVDYWDYIGWKDRFGMPAFAARQRDTVRRQGGNAVYTPQVMLNGQDMRLWSNASRFDSRVKELASRPARAGLVLQATQTQAGLDVVLSTTIPAAQDRGDADIFLAVTENNLASRVTAGENRGVTLKHDHVVRDLVGPLLASPQGAAAEAGVVQRSIPLPRDWKRNELVLVAFAQSRRNGEVLQAVSVPLCGQ